MVKKQAKRAAKAEVKKLYRSSKDKILGGVCGGIAEYLGVDPTIIRVLWILISLAYGAGIILYLLLWLIMPVKQ